MKFSGFIQTVHYCGPKLLPENLKSLDIYMHEMSIAMSMIEIVKEEMRKCDAKKLRSVRLNVGQLSAVVPEALSFCFEVVTKGTEMEGARLVMDICEKEFEIKDYVFACPFCASKDIKTLSGQDLAVVEIEVE